MKRVRRTVIAIGEILWDVFPDRVCFGGAPANFACAIAELGAKSVDVQMLSAVGLDDLGNKAIEELESHGVRTGLVQRPDKGTGEVRVSLNADGSANYEFASDVAWDHLEWSENLAAMAKQAHAVCFGTLGQRCEQSARTIQEFVRHTPSDCLKVLDINLRFPHVVNEAITEGLELCNILKLNEEELPYLAEWLHLRGSNFEILEQIEKRFSLELVALTLGSGGAVLKSDACMVETHSETVKVVDTVGAGDAFTAALILGLLNNRGTKEEAELQNLVSFANRVAGFVCTQPGATPAFPSEFTNQTQVLD